MKDLMIDIETLGTNSNSVILSIGAAFFDLKTGEVGSTFHTSINIESCLNVGLKASANTALWWMQNEKALENWAESKKQYLDKALYNFSNFIQGEELLDQDGKTIVWGNSNRFDLGLLENAYNAVEMEIPWNFRNERDVRTLVAFNPTIKYSAVKAAKESGVLLHDALEDCKLQIKYCSEIYNSLIKV